MKNTDYINKNVFKAIRTTITEEAKKMVSIIEMEYTSLQKELGNAEARYEVEKQVENIILLSIFGKGQRALIGEFGKGSEIDLNNPALKEYINGDIFNKERLKHNMEIITRVNDESYKDLDDREIVRPKPKNEVGLEDKKNRYEPVKPRHILRTTLEQRLDIIINAIAEAVAIEVAFEKLIDGMKVKVVI